MTQHHALCFHIATQKRLFLIHEAIGSNLFHNTNTVAVALIVTLI